MIKTFHKAFGIIVILFVIVSFMGCDIFDDDEEEEYCGQIIVPVGSEHVILHSEGDYKMNVFFFEGEYFRWESFDGGECWTLKDEE
jgi:hypothetical protein